MWWGLGAFGNKSYRTLAAEADDEARKRNLRSLSEVAKLMSEMLWDQYTSAFSEEISRAKELEAKGNTRTDKENQELDTLEQKRGALYCRAMG